MRNNIMLQVNDVCQTEEFGLVWIHNIYYCEESWCEIIQARPVDASLDHPLISFLREDLQDV